MKGERETRRRETEAAANKAKQLTVAAPLMATPPASLMPAPPYALTEAQLEENASLSSHSGYMLIDELSSLTKGQMRILLDFYDVFRSARMVAFQTDMEDRLVSHFLKEQTMIIVSLAYSELLDGGLSKSAAARELHLNYQLINLWKKWYEKHESKLKDWVSFWSGEYNPEGKSWVEVCRSSSLAADALSRTQKDAGQVAGC